MGNGTKLRGNSQCKAYGSNSTGSFKAGGEQRQVFMKADKHSRKDA